jgi:hypothetical protein
VDFPNHNLYRCDFLKSLLNHLFRFWVFGVFSLAESEMGLFDFGFLFCFFLQDFSEWRLAVVFLSGDKGGEGEREKNNKN